MKKGTTTLIPQNIAPSSAKRLSVFDGDGKKVCDVGLGNLAIPQVGSKLYSFGAISDIHLQYDTAQADFQRALTYFNETEDVEFTCICGDLTSNGTDENMAVYKSYINTYSSDTPVYEVAGNHESYTANSTAHTEEELKTLMKTYTGKDLWYSVNRGSDVFIFVGDVYAGSIFGTGELQWLYETLEVNRNKRCFLFQHVRPNDACGNAYGIYSHDIWRGYGTVDAIVFENLLKHYKNVIFFHGHSHLRFELQSKTNLANYDSKYGMHSIHIPSLAVPRTGDITGANSREELYSESEGYVVDVYENHVVLRGRDFVKGEFLPIATYCLDTTLQTIAQNTFTDSTGTITT